jgi:hypothetical protein
VMLTALLKSKFIGATVVDGAKANWEMQNL